MLLKLLNNFTIPNSVTKCSNMFNNCTYLTSAIPDAWNNNPLPVNYSYYALRCINSSNYNIIPTGWK